MSSTPDPKESDAIEDEVISTDGTVISQAFRWSLLGLVVLGGVVFGVTTLLSDQAGEVEEIIESIENIKPNMKMSQKKTRMVSKRNDGSREMERESFP